MGLKTAFEKTLSEKFIGTSDRSSSKSILVERVLIPLLTKFSGVEDYEEICDEKLLGLSASKADDLEEIFNRLRFNVSIHSNTHTDLNAQYIIVSNHPTGPLEGIFIQKIFNQLGLRGKTMGDDIMSGVAQMKDAYLGISTRVNGKSRISQLRAIKKEISSGLSLGLFPAGSVSHFDFKNLRVKESEWHPGFIEMAKSNNLDILPVFIDTNLSVLYYFFKLVYSDISSLRLFKESRKFIDRNKGKYINIYIGNPIEISNLESTKENAFKIQEICENLKYQAYTHSE